MRDKLVITECNSKNGFITVAAVYRGERHHMNYQGYSKCEALKRFRAFVLGKYNSVS